jgi:CBS domain containing-hemolysin-like protein
VGVWRKIKGWGIFTILIGSGLSFIAISISLGVVKMTPQAAPVFFWVGVSIISLATLLALIWLFKPSEDLTARRLDTIIKLLEEEKRQGQNIQVFLVVLDWIIGKFRKGK